jgi:hypothetical protein
MASTINALAYTYCVILSVLSMKYCDILGFWAENVSYSETVKGSPQGGKAFARKAGVSARHRRSFRQL